VSSISDDLRSALYDSAPLPELIGESEIFKKGQQEAGEGEDVDNDNDDDEERRMLARNLTPRADG